MTIDNTMSDEKSDKVACLGWSSFHLKSQGWISDMGIDGTIFVSKSGYFLPIFVKVCPQKLAFS